MSQITHLDDQGNSRMVDVSVKKVSKRIAKAQGQVVFPIDVYQKIIESHGQTAKGSIVEVAKIAGVMAAKNTSQLIPMCHPMMIEKCDLQFQYDDDSHALWITAEVAVTHKTGVEMEALTAVSVAALTVYDMTKALSHEIEIRDVALVQKSGGKRDYERVKNQQASLEVFAKSTRHVEITVQYFAQLQSIANREQELIEVPEFCSPAYVYAQLDKRYGFGLAMDSLKVAINDRFASWEQALQEHDKLVFIPPVAGG